MKMRQVTLFNPYLLFVLYFMKLEKLGIPYGLNDLRRKALELGTPMLA